MENKVNLFIATPCYANQCHTDYLHSIMSYHKAGIPFTVFTLGNESLIPRARNSCISYFYGMMGFSHLLFLDADIYLHADGLIKLLSHDKDVIGAPVALKGFDAAGNPVYNTGKILAEEEGGLIKVDKVGTAVFILSRDAVNELISDAEKNKDVYYSNPHTRGDANSNMKMYDVFKTGVFNGEYDSEDYYVCRTLRRLGFDIYVDTTVSNRHNGNYVFGT